MIQNRTLSRFRLTISLALLLLVVLVGCSTALTSARAVPSRTGSANTWSVSQNGTILQIGYGSGTSFPQYAALDLSSSYFRMIYSTTAQWGTSAILLPVYWSQTSCPPPGLCQGAAVTATWQTLNASSTLSLSPPAYNALTAYVTTTVTGHTKLDNRPGEAFKPVMLSSMHISS